MTTIWQFLFSSLSSLQGIRSRFSKFFGIINSTSYQPRGLNFPFILPAPKYVFRLLLGSSLSGTTRYNYQIKKIAEIQTFQRFLFCPKSPENGKSEQSEVYKSGTVGEETILFTVKRHNLLMFCLITPRELIEMVKFHWFSIIRFGYHVQNTKESWILMN